MKTIILKCQNHGIIYPFTKVVTFFIAIVSIMTVENMTIEKVIRIIGWLDILEPVLSLCIPEGCQTFFEMLASSDRIEVSRSY